MDGKKGDAHGSSEGHGSQGPHAREAWEARGGGTQGEGAGDERGARAVAGARVRRRRRALGCEGPKRRAGLHHGGDQRRVPTRGHERRRGELAHVHLVRRHGHVLRRQQGGHAQARRDLQRQGGRRHLPRLHPLLRPRRHGGPGVEPGGHAVRRLVRAEPSGQRHADLGVHREAGRVRGPQALPGGTRQRLDRRRLLRVNLDLRAGVGREAEGHRADATTRLHQPAEGEWKPVHHGRQRVLLARGRGVRGLRREHGARRNAHDGRRRMEQHARGAQAWHLLRVGEVGEPGVRDVRWHGRRDLDRRLLVPPGDREARADRDRSLQRASRERPDVHDYQEG